jgi:cytochrome c-type biogenesis protein CcmH/NrfG
LRPEPLIAVGVAYAARGRLDDAVVTLGRAAERFPRSPAPPTALGRIWLDAAMRTGGSDELSRAIEVLETAVANPAASSEAHALLGRARLRAGLVPEAAAALRLATTRFPIAPGAFESLADAEARLGHAPAAQAAATRARQLDAARP